LVIGEWLIGEWLIGEWLIGEWLIGEWLIGEWLIDDWSVAVQLTVTVHRVIYLTPAIFGHCERGKAERGNL
jgi:hypothetical protein